VKTTLVKKIQSSLFAGLLFLVPVVLTFWIVYRVFFWLDGLLNEPVSRLIFSLLAPHQLGRSIPGIGLLALIILLLSTGLMVRNVAGRFIIKWSDLLFSRIPVVRHIYNTFQQIGNAFLSDSSVTFKKAVLFEYPRQGVFSIGFITQDTQGPVQRAVAAQFQKDCYSVFLPTTPNPTSGFLLFIPKNQVVELNISIEEALKLIISGGAIIPLEKAKDEPQLMDGQLPHDAELPLHAYELPQ
jgi:uncharacterized membrane protein